MHRHLLAGIGLACLAASAAHAQTVDAPAKPLWELGVAGGVVSTPSYPGAADRETRGLALPLIIYRGKVFRADQGGIGARVFKSDTAELDVGLAASLPARSNDVAARAGMPDLGGLAEFGPRLKLRLARFDAQSGLRAELPLRGGVRSTQRRAPPGLYLRTAPGLRTAQRSTANGCSTPSSRPLSATARSTAISTKCVPSLRPPRAPPTAPTPA